MKRLIRFLFILILSLIFSLGIPILFPVSAQQSIFTQQKLEPLALVEKGKNYYDNGQFFKAIKILQQAEQIYQVREDLLKQAQVLSFISFAQQKLGNFPAAESAIANSFVLLENLATNKSRNKVRAQVLNAQGHLLLEREILQQP